MSNNQSMNLGAGPQQWKDQAASDDLRLEAPLNTPFIASGQWSGRGKYLQITISAGQAGTTVTVAHNLGRKPQMALLLDTGDAVYPAWSWPKASRTATTLGLNMPVAGTYLFWFS